MDIMKQVAEPHLISLLQLSGFQGAKLIYSFYFLLNDLYIPQDLDFCPIVTVNLQSTQ